MSNDDRENINQFHLDSAQIRQQAIAEAVVDQHNKDPNAHPALVIEGGGVTPEGVDKAVAAGVAEHNGGEATREGRTFSLIGMDPADPVAIGVMPALGRIDVSEKAAWLDALGAKWFCEKSRIPAAITALADYALLAADGSNIALFNDSGDGTLIASDDSAELWLGGSYEAVAVDNTHASLLAAVQSELAAAEDVMARKKDLTSIETRLTALEQNGGSIDLKNLELTDATWTMRGNSRIIFSPGAASGAGVYFDDAAMMTMYNGYTGKEAIMAQNLCSLNFAAYAGNVSIAGNASYLDVGTSANEARFGDNASRALFGTGWGENIYCSLSDCLRTLDITDAEWALRGNSKIKFYLESQYDEAGIFANSYCMLTFAPSWDMAGVNAWVAHGACVALIGNDTGKVEFGTYASEACFGQDGQNNRFGGTACSNIFGEGAGQNTFGAWSEDNTFGTETGTNHYYGI